MAGVQYNDGAFYLLVLALLAMYMLPATGSFIYSEVTRPVYKAGPCDTAARRKANTPSLKRFNTFWSYVLIGCWVLFIGLLTLEGVITAVSAAPAAIFGGGGSCWASDGVLLRAPRVPRVLQRPPRQASFARYAALVR